MKGIQFEEATPSKVTNVSEAKSSTITKSEKGGTPENTPKNIEEAAVQNFGKILELAGDIAEIKKMKVASDAVLAKMEADRKQMLAEAEVYVEKKNADTKNVIERMNIIRLMMQDFYQQSNQQITGEDFRQIITSIVDQMGRIDNG